MASLHLEALLTSIPAPIEGALPSGPPEISDELLAIWHHLLRPLKVDLERGTIYEIDCTTLNLRNTAFNWDPKLGPAVEIEGVVDACVTVHSFGAPAFFKPSVAEVLAQIPEKLNRIAFWQRFWNEGLSCGYFLVNDGFHSVRSHDAEGHHVKGGDWHKANCTFVTYRVEEGT